MERYETYYIIVGCFLLMYFFSCSDDRVFSDYLYRANVESAFFAFSFFAEDPEKIGIDILLSDIETSDACSYFTSLKEVGNENLSFTTLKISTNKAAAGEYSVTGRALEVEDYFGEDLLASVSVTIYKGKDDYTTYFADSGAVTISSSPSTIAEWNEGKELTGDLSVYFSADPAKVTRRDVGCDSEGICSYSCTCETFSGSTYEVSDVSEIEECCAENEGESLSLVLSIGQAHQCKEACAILLVFPPFPDHCIELQ